MQITDIPKNPVVRREWIKFQLRLKGWSLSRLAATVNYERSTLCLALSKPYPKAEMVVANALGLTPQLLWPERYAADGLPARHSPKFPRKGITRKKRIQCISLGD